MAEPARSIEGPAWVLLAAEGKARGFRNALSFRRWCRRRGVTIRRDGKLLWVSPRDVDRAVEALDAPPPAPPANDVEAQDRAAAVAALMGRG